MDAPYSKALASRASGRRTGVTGGGRTGRLASGYRAEPGATSAVGGKLPPCCYPPPVKHHRLRAVAHNLADSLASGLCFVIGYWETNVFAEAAADPRNFIEVDFLNGLVDGKASASLLRAVSAFRDALPDFCARNGVEEHDFRRLSARYEGRGFFGGYEVTTEDRSGRHSVVRYVGNPGKRQIIKDQLGRIRRAPVFVQRVGTEGAAPRPQC